MTLQPRTDVVKVVNRATTGAAGSGNSLSVERQHATDRVVITGSIAADHTGDTEWVTVPDPTAYAADVLERALEAGASGSAATSARVRPPTVLPCSPATSR